MESKRKLLFVIPGLDYAGTNTSFSSLYNNLCDTFHIDVFPFCYKGNGRYKFREAIVKGSFLTTSYYGHFRELSFPQMLIAVILKPFRRLCDLGPLIQNITVKYLELKPYDAIIAFQEKETTQFVSRFKNPNKIAWVHCDYRNATPEEIDEEDVYIKFKQIVCVSQYTRYSFAQRYPRLDKRTIAINNLLDTDRILNFATEIIDDSRFNTNCFTIISVGRLNAVKRFNYIPKIAAKLKNYGLLFKWYIIGEGEERKTISDTIKLQNVEEYVFLLGSKSNPYPYFKKADILVSTSVSEACPMIFNEAKMLGLPIISADFPTAKEFINNGINGIIAPIEEIWLRITELMVDNEWYSTIKSNSYLDPTYNKAIISQLEDLFKL